MKQIDFLVCVRCFTFNHAPYIKDAMDGFCMQQTSFPFVCVIVDDASTDGEPNVVRTYMEQHFNIDDKNVVRNVETDDYVMTFAQHKTNENCFFAVYYLKYNHYSIKKDKFPYFTEYHDKAKYIALCEGDDYWIDPGKLQEQVDFLESHPKYSMCFHNARLKNETNYDFKLIEVENREYQKEELFERWVVPTASMMMHGEIMKFLPIDTRIINGDINIVMNACAHGKVYGISKVMSVYRVQSNGITIKRAKENMLELQKNYIAHYTALKELYGIPSKTYGVKMSDTYINLGVSYLRLNIIMSIVSLAKGCYYSPVRFGQRIIMYVKKMI